MAGSIECACLAPRPSAASCSARLANGQAAARGRADPILPSSTLIHYGVGGVPGPLPMTRQSSRIRSWPSGQRPRVSSYQPP
jgi:hypothetical protein